jgi:ACS family tartrate transporter-like MFS transporter
MGNRLMGEDAVARTAIKKISWRLLPLILLSYLISYMDRSNISFASVQMNADLRFSAAVYGLGAGLFFVGYAIFEVPSNLLLARFGARRWIARIMLTWGLISIGTMFVRTPVQFYAIRFLLGVAEAGFFPGVMLYLSSWYPNRWRGRAVSRFYIAVPLGTVLMGAVAGALLGLDGWMSLKGWQWLFLVEGLPAVLMALLLLLYLPDGPGTVTWLSNDEKSWVTRALAADIDTGGIADHGFFRALLDPLVLAIGLAVALCLGCSNAIMFSGPKLLIDATGWSMVNVGFLISLSGVVTTAAMLACGWNSDRCRERYLHLAGAIGISALCVGTMALTISPLMTVLGYLFFIVAALNIGMLGFLIIADDLNPSARVVGFAAMNTIAQIGSFAGPALWGLAADRTDSFHFGLSVIPFVMLAAAGLVLAKRRRVMSIAAVVTIGDG